MGVDKPFLETAKGSKLLKAVIDPVQTRLYRLSENSEYILTIAFCFMNP